jgi:hypothetical protein
MANDVIRAPKTAPALVTKRLQVRERVRRYRQRRRDGLIYIPGLLMPDVPLEMMLVARGFLAADCDDGDAIVTAVENLLLALIVESEAKA